MDESTSCEPIQRRVSAKKWLATWIPNSSNRNSSQFLPAL